MDKLTSLIALFVDASVRAKTDEPGSLTREHARERAREALNDIDDEIKFLRGLIMQSDNA